MNVMSWLQYSDISISISLNPVRWLQAELSLTGPDDMNPKMRAFYFRALFLTVQAVIDDGSW